MKAEDIYDPQGQGCTKEEWERLPLVVRQQYSLLQQEIQREVESKNPGKYGPTSGYRSWPGNSRVGGSENSLHPHAAARDFVRRCRTCGLDRGPVVGPKFRVIKSKGCWHVEIV